MSREKILVIDDTPGNRYAVTRILRMEGYEVIEGTKGSDALRLAAAERPDLIILDIKLPDMLGFEANEILRRTPETAHISILNVSASYTSADAQALGLGRGADGYLVHPIDPQVLSATVRALLRLRRAERRAAEALAREQAARAIAEDRERQYRFLAEMVPQIIWTAESDGAVDYWNQHWTEASGMEKTESLGWGWLRAIHEEDVDHLVMLWRRALVTGESHEVEYRLRNVKDGTYSWRLRRAAALKDDEGNVIKWFGSSTDIDPQKRAQHEREELIVALRHSEARLKRLWDSGLIGIVYWTADGCLLDANDAFLEMIGYARDELHVIDLNALTPPEIRDDAQRELARTGVSDTYETQYLRKDGSRVDVIVGTAAFAHEPGHGLAFALDITDRKRFERERSRLMRELQDALRSRDEFLSIASHDLKGPLTGMSLRVEALLRAAAKGGDVLPAETVVPKLRAVAAQIEQMVRLLEVLLDVSRISSGSISIEREQVDLCSVVRAASERLTEQAQRAGSPLRVQASQATIVGEWDRTRIDQVVTNLMTNAIKYGAGNPIDVRLESTATSARLSVHDRGIGISAEDQERIFERFERVESNRDAAGVGLGLWIVRRIVEALGGSISVRSRVGEGSVFSVELPRAPVAASTTASTR